MCCTDLRIRRLGFESLRARSPHPHATLAPLSLDRHLPHLAAFWPHQPSRPHDRGVRRSGPFRRGTRARTGPCRADAGVPSGRRALPLRSRRAGALVQGFERADERVVRRQRPLAVARLGLFEPPGVPSSYLDDDRGRQPSWRRISESKTWNSSWLSVGALCCALRCCWPGALSQVRTYCKARSSGCSGSGIGWMAIPRAICDARCTTWPRTDTGGRGYGGGSFPFSRPRHPRQLT